ncbi:MAG: bifunctional nuclease family protein [Prevotella sp.]|nr:bifunctional nuclease family protein [Prevotella sp.]MBR1462850.1 bifunctional nuclease family protein [Prevotella sp.]
MDKVRLVFKGVSEIVGGENLGLLILTDEQCEQQISIICEKSMAVQLELRAKGLPIADILLPEVMCKVIANQTHLRLELIITNLINGQYRVILCNTDTLDYVPIRASDAVLLSVAGNIPLYIVSQLMLRQSVRYSANQNGVSIPVNTLSDDMLESALGKAIDDENYELASHLRDEKRRRQLPNNQQQS